MTDVDLVRRAAPLVEAFRGRLPLRRELQDINDHFGTPIATTVFAQSVEALPHYGGFIRRVRSFDARQFSGLREKAQEFEVVILRSSLPLPEISWGQFADEWQSWARALGFKTDIIETREDNDVRANAKLISKYLFTHPHPHPHPHPRRILVTYGQGAAEFRSLLALRLGLKGEREPLSAETASDAGELSSIAAWINVTGGYSGSGFAKLTNESWWHSLTMKLTSSFRTPTGNARLRRLIELDTRLPIWQRPPNFPVNLQVINIVGQTFRSDIRLSRVLDYDRLSKVIGPNDGATGLYESIAHPGLIVPVPGLTCLAEPAKLEPVMKRVLSIIAADAVVETAIRPADESVTTL